jgi:hypothetical protein
VKIQKQSLSELDGDPPHALYSELGMSDIARQSHYRKWMSEAMATEVLGKIRASLEKRLVQGTDRFREQVSGLMR